MIIFLRVFFIIMFVAITASVIAASLDTAIWAIPSEVTGDAWFKTTLVDIYVSFLAFYTWVAYRETRWSLRIIWLIAILCLGSMAVTAYCIIRLFAVKADSSIAAVLLRESDWRGVRHAA